MVVAPAARRLGLGKRLQNGAAAKLFARGALAVFGEINDPAGSEVARARLARNQRWGARVVDIRYVQPALAPGLARDRGLVLIALAGAQPLPAEMRGEVIRNFVAELYDVTEHGPPDPEIEIPEAVRLLTLA